MPPTATPHFAAPRKVFADRDGRRRFVGETRDGDAEVMIYVHADRTLRPVRKQDLVGGAVWDTHEAIRSAAETAGCSFDAMAAYVAEQLPELLRHFPLSGRVCPDLAESTDVGNSSSGHRNAA